ncbi:hypothetical protein [Hymenobacter sp. CRA2]|uniref:hypothetical protein n=1 Tax=Hymenobacter sp. CRA2 TaxID=1955620 RepID=UPI00098F121B|nr:hypothetical protein [Hymenobacter sp. CRA2]OON70545.1 hypothetical protein B0919_00520 [Hymenobacter sp. CRA2]
MKKSLVFAALLFSSFSVFATTSPVVTKEDKTVPTENAQLSAAVFDYNCVDVTLSCGLHGQECGETTSEIITKVIAAEEAYCGD